MSFRTLLALFVVAIPCFAATPSDAARIDPYETQMTFCGFPFARTVALDTAGAWGVMYADTYGKLHLLRATERGWKLEWEITNLGAKVRKFFFCDLDANGVMDFVVATVSGRIVAYDMDTYQSLWENLEDRFQSIEAIDIGDVDTDPQLEIVVLADKRIRIIDGLNKSKQWVSPETFEASEMLVTNVDKDPQPEIVLNSGIIVDSRFLNIEIEWDRPFGDRMVTADMNNDGYPEIIGEFSDYSLRIFDVYARREVW